LFGQAFQADLSFLRQPGVGGSFGERFEHMTGLRCADVLEGLD
jgi:hypothetical protein